MSTVSIIIPVRNRARFIRGAIESALIQTHRDCEVIVVDDGSTDGTRDILEYYRSRITVVKQAEANQAVALNRALARATGRIIAFLDSDDLMPADRIGRSLSSMGLADVLVHPMEAIDDNGEPLNVLVGPPPWLFSGGHPVRLFERNYLSRIQCLFRRDVLGPAPFNEQLPMCQDYALYLELVRREANFRYVPYSLYLYRIHEGNISKARDVAREVEGSILRGISLGEVEHLYASAGLDEATVVFGLAMVVLRRGEYDAAEKMFEEANRKRGGSDAHSLFYMAVLDMAAGRAARAEWLLTTCRQLDSEEPTIQNNLGVLHALRGDLASALKLFSQALRALPAYLDAKSNLTLLRSNGDFSELRFTPALLKRELIVNMPARPQAKNQSPIAARAAA